MTTDKHPTEMVEKPFDFVAIYKEARERFLNDATNPACIDETIARVAYEHGRASLQPTKGEEAA